MKRRYVGGIEVSEVGMGCMGFSHGYGAIPDRRYSIEAIRDAYGLGCTFFDTAETYGDVLYHPGHNEQILGEALEGIRPDVAIATKFHINPEDISNGGIRASSVRKHLECSLRNLRTDYVDLYYLHRVNEAVPVEEVALIMGDLIKEGVIRGWGLSQVSSETLRAAHETVEVSAVQNLYNILERDCERDIFPYCAENGIGIVAFSPIASGFLSGRITEDTVFEEKDDVRAWVPQLSRENIRGNQPILSVLKRYAEAKGATPAQISIAWMLRKHPGLVPIPGSKNKERIRENLAGCDVGLADEEFADLERALAACEVCGHRGHIESEQATFGNAWK